MKKFFRFFLTLLLFGGWTLAAASLHIVRVPNEQGYIVLIPKNRLGFKQTYVDVRMWTRTDLESNEMFVLRMRAADKDGKLAHADVDALPATQPVGRKVPSETDHILKSIFDSTGKPMTDVAPTRVPRHTPAEESTEEPKSGSRLFPE